MRAAFAGWMVKITINFIRQAQVNGFIKDIEIPHTFMGTVQPLDPDEIKLKPEGQRSWEWLDIHCFSGNLNLETNDKIIFNKIKYKVMAVKDWSLNNYIEYHLVRDYQDAE